MKPSKKNKTRLEYIQEKLKPIEELFFSLAVGKYNVDFEFPKKEDEFTELYTGIKLMLDSSKEELNNQKKLNQKIKSVSKNREQLFNELQKITHLGTWEWNKKNNLILCSDEMLKICGINIESKKTDYNTLTQLIHKDDKKPVDYILKKAFIDHNPFKIYLRISLKEKIKFIEVRGHIETKRNIPIRIYGTVQDITELKETKEKLFLAKQELETKVSQRTRDLERAYRNLETEIRLKEKALEKEKSLSKIVESSNDAILSKDLNGIIKSWNEGATKMYGYTENEIVGQHISKIVPSERLSELKSIMEKVSIGEKLKVLETIRKRKDGSLIHVSLTISPIKDYQEKIIGASTIGRDITEIVANKKRFEIAVEASPNAMILVNEKGEIILTNTQTEKVFGYKKNELLGESIEKLIPKEIRKNHISYRKNYHQNPHARPMGIGKELYGIKKNGSKVSVEIGLNPIETSTGKMVLASIVDISERKKFEDEIKQREQRYDALIETMNEGVLIVDNDDKIMFANEFMCNMLGYELNEIKNKIARELFIDDEDKQKIDEINELLKIGESNKYEIQILTKHKQKLWMLVSGSPMYDIKGNIIGSIGLHTNITTRKLIEQELNAIANIPAENPNPTFRFSVHGQILMYANPASKSTLDFFDNQENKAIRKEWIKHINETYQLNQPVKKELKVKDKTYMCTIVPVKKNGYVNVYSVDITATKKAEAEIKKLSLVLSKTENAVLIADNKGNIQWVNEGFKTITGYSLDEVNGTHGEQLRKGRKTGLNKNHPYFKKMVTSKKSVSYESHNYKKNGQEYWSITTLTPIFDNKGDLETIIAIDTDITYKKHAEKEILKSKRIAEESAKAKELFLANMSHEIRTPMNAIMGIIQLLRDTKLDQNQLAYLKSMDFASENLLRIINDVLDLSKIESGKMSIEKIPFNLDRLTQDIFNSISHRANEKGLELLKSIDSNVPDKIIGDPVRINQILINLISNAIKFTENGFIKLEIKTSKLVKDTVTLKFSLKDTGIGISEEMHELIFSDFEQANKETTRKYGGTGLGLSIVKRLVELQDGTVNVKSKEGKGSTFTFEIPFEIAKEEYIDTPLEQVEELEKELNETSVLLIEDNPLNQMVATKFLETIGMKVKIANNGLEGVNELKRNNYDIVLMDIQMPNMDGYEASKFIRKTLKSKVPILAMTAHAISGEKDKCLSLGMDDYITKPLKREHLKSKILTLLKNKIIK